GAGQSDVDLKRDLAKYYLGADQARNNPQNNPVLQGINPTDVPSMLPSTTAPWHRSDADPDPNAPVTITGNAQDGLGVNVSMLGGNQINSQQDITNTNSWSVKTTTTDPHDDAKSAVTNNDDGTFGLKLSKLDDPSQTVQASLTSSLAVSSMTVDGQSL